MMFEFKIMQFPQAFTSENDNICKVSQMQF